MVMYFAAIAAGAQQGARRRNPNLLAGVKSELAQQKPKTYFKLNSGLSLNLAFSFRFYSVKDCAKG